MDPTGEPEDPVCLLVREDLMREYLTRENLTICWIINGEKRIFGAHFSVIHPPLKIMSAYVLSEIIITQIISLYATQGGVVIKENDVISRRFCLPLLPDLR